MSMIYGGPNLGSVEGYGYKGNFASHCVSSRAKSIMGIVWPWTISGMAKCGILLCLHHHWLLGWSY